MGAYCKVCQSALRDDIDAYLMGGATPKWLAQWCSDRGFQVSHTSIRNHAKSHIVGYNAPKSHVTKVAKDAKNPNIEPDPTIVNFDEYCHRLGLNPSDFENLEDNLEKVIGASQKALTLLFFRESAILDSKLNAHAHSKGIHPMEHIKGLRSIFEMYSRVMGIDKLIDENSALQTLESMGYTIQKTIDIDAN
ncbi:hypothetical protein [Gloeothece verrucosa]|uniref:Uncharacterized protein n=1 Tax=Gloeothece verrucosa (strain PCC 7822) TaxID=497965 RepID=E0UP08_GLOV7|nr:hypothetical protein [Gloeothece verrucosa]ADN18688.1 hypothetical protein Cyan7822_6206 [Gloeothece verrucosa PCC 7822]